MMTLSEVNILKSFKKLVIDRPPKLQHKYIRRWFENGKWQYEYPKEFSGRMTARYEEPESGGNSQGGFGTIWGDYSGRPRAAFEKLFKERSGQCSNVFTIKLPVLAYDAQRDRFVKVKQHGTDEYLYADTSVDLVWGNSKIGIEHIVDKHYVRNNDFNSIEELQDKISDEMNDFQFHEKNLYFQFEGKFPGMSITTKKNNKFVFVAQFKKQKNGDILFRHYILTSYDRSRGEKQKKNSPEEVNRRQVIFDEYGK